MTIIDSRPVPDCITRDNLTSPYWPKLSFGGLCAVVTLSVIFMLTSFNRLNHTDLWGHVNFGRWVATHELLPAHDPFAANPTDISVLHGAWLSQVMGYEVQRWFGNEGLVFGHALLVTLTAGVVMLAAHRRGAPALWASAAGITMFVLDLPIVGTIRPQLFGQLGAALCLLACAELPRRKHPLVWLPIVAILWASLHGSIPMGLAILTIYAAGVTWNAYWEAKGSVTSLISNRDLSVVWLAVLLTLGAACINPHGPLLLVRVLFFNEHGALAAISEWRALAPRSLTGVLMIVSVGTTVLLARFSPRKWEAHEIALLVVFGLATLPAIRMLAWWAIVWPVMIAPHAAAVWQRYMSKLNENSIADVDEPTSMRTVLAMGFVLMALLIAPPSFSLVAGRGRGEGLITVTDTPVYVADEIARRGLSGNMAAPMDWADFFVWKTSGAIKPLVYSHVHLTDIATWRDYESIYRGDETWLHTLQNRGMQFVVVPTKRYPKLAKLVVVEDRSGRSGLHIIYQDQRCILAELSPVTTTVSAPATGL